jgi:hypothetical protein
LSDFRTDKLDYFNNSKTFSVLPKTFFVHKLIGVLQLYLKSINKIDEIKIKFWQIINMNVGFFEFSIVLVLQQSAVNPIYDFLGASPDQYLNLAGH